MGAALGTPPIVAAIVEHELAVECVDEDPMFSDHEKSTTAHAAGRRSSAASPRLMKADAAVSSWKQLPASTSQYETSRRKLDPDRPT